MELLKKILRPVYVPVFNIVYKHRKAPKRYRYLFDEIERIKAVRILEVGTWNGNRATEMIKKAQEASGQRVTYIGFDLFQDLSDKVYHEELSKRPPTLEAVSAKLETTGAQIELYKGNTLDTLVEYANRAEKVDFIFIDGGHSVETIKSDWQAVSKLMHKNTVVIFDDYWRNRPHESAKPVVDNIDKQIYRVEILPEVDKFNNPDFGRLEISFAKVSMLKK